MMPPAMAIATSTHWASPTYRAPAEWYVHITMSRCCDCPNIKVENPDMPRTKAAHTLNRCTVLPPRTVTWLAPAICRLRQPLYIDQAQGRSHILAYVTPTSEVTTWVMGPYQVWWFVETHTTAVMLQEELTQISPGQKTRNQREL